jgi:hypothetical protein
MGRSRRTRLAGGHGWHNDRWGVWPTADDLERVAPSRVVALWAPITTRCWSATARWPSPGSTSDRRIRRAA